MIVVLAILGVLSAVAIVSYGYVKETGRTKVSAAQLSEARLLMQRARDREQATLAEIVGGAGSAAACRQNPLPPVTRLTGACKAAWDQVNLRLGPYAGSQQAAAQAMTDGAARPILVDAREAGCPGGGIDTLTSVHPTGARGKPVQQVQLARSGYGC
ncbi:MAG: hypothetical protein ABI200_03725 [Gaiellales bacterium]